MLAKYKPVQSKGVFQAPFQLGGHEFYFWLTEWKLSIQFDFLTHTKTCVFFLPNGRNAEVIAGAQAAILVYKVGARHSAWQNKIENHCCFFHFA